MAIWCALCDAGQPEVNGWHIIVNSEPGLESTSRVACAIWPPDVETVVAEL